ncbi:hypothetical protein D3C73_1028130 [compost metagenome]
MTILPAFLISSSVFSAALGLTEASTLTGAVELLGAAAGEAVETELVFEFPQAETINSVNILTKVMDHFLIVISPFLLI